MNPAASPWSPPAEWRRLTTLDAHTGGEPLRIVTSGVPEIPGSTMLAKRSYARQHLDGLRRLLMWEPRGHADMYGCILTPPVTQDGDVGVLFLHNEGFSTMCGHGIIALVTAALETGLLPKLADGAGEPGTNHERTRRVVRIDTPAGRVTATAHQHGGRVERVSFLNVPSFVLATDLVVHVPEIGDVRCDVAFGGAFYAYVDAAALGLELIPERYREIIDVGTRIKQAVVASSLPIRHPDGDADLGFLYGTILVERLAPGGAHSRNVCVFAEGEVDRSPTGTGVSGRVALHHARGELAPGQSIVVESLLGTRFTGRVASETRVGDVAAVVPEISGSAHLTGRHEFFLDPDDPLGPGFFLR